MTILSAQGQWDLIAPVPPRIAAYSSCLTGNTVYFWCRNNVVFSSSNGGTSVVVYPPYAGTGDVSLGCCDRQGIAFADSLTGYVVDNAHGEFRTTDGGWSWTQMGSIGSNIELVLFGNDKIGWKFGDGGTYRTTNAGISWQFINAPYAYGGIWGKVYALDTNRIWLAKSYYEGRLTEGSIWYSKNSGFQWKQLASAPKTDSITKVEYSDLKINPSGIGVAVGILRRGQSNYSGFAARTEDFGSTWDSTEFPFERPKTLLSVGDSVWMMFGSSPAYIRRSTDSGRSWIRTDNVFATANNPTTEFGSAQYVPTFNSIVVSTTDGIFTSTDAGTTFNKMTAPLNLNIIDIEIERSSNTERNQLIIAMAPSDSFIMSENGGDSWVKKSLPRNSYWNFDEAEIAGGMIYLTRDQTGLFKTSNMGISWEQIKLPIYSGIRGLFAFSADIISLHMYKSILYSQNGGETWENNPFPAKYWVNESSMPNHRTIVAGGGYNDTLGTRGFIYRTTNAGYDWQIVDFPREINHLSMISPTTGIAISNYELYRTVDGGARWNKILSSADYFTHYVDFFFKDSLRGLLRVSFDFFETIDGGKSWKGRALGLPIYSLSKIKRTNQGMILAVGDGMLWRSTSITGYQMESEQYPPFGDQKEPISMIVYPNPFNPSTTIRYKIPEQSFVTITVFDILGRVVEVLVNEQQYAGWNQIRWTPNNVATGVYFSTLKVGAFIQSKKIMLVK